MNPLDKLIGIFSPQTAINRARARLVLRAYEGANKKDGWSPRRPGASANTDHTADAATLRVRARSLEQNCPYINRALSVLVANVVGTGIVPRPTGPNAKVLAETWAAWSKVADADARLELAGLVATAYRAAERDGEVLIRLRTRRPEDGLPVPLQLQVLEIDWLDTGKQGANNLNPIVNGIEYDALGKPAAYWLHPCHPGEMASLRKTTPQRVPASQIIHYYNPERPGQGRGFSRLAPIITRVRDLTLYEDAEIQRKNLETRLSVLASGDASLLASAAPELDADPDTARQTGELGSLPSGGLIELPPGVNVTVVEPKASPGYVDYVKFGLQIIAAGFGVPYEAMVGDVSQTNFSSARVRLQDFRRECEQTQWLVLIPRMIEPIYRAFVDHAVLAGVIRRPDYSVDWSTPRWEYVNPEQDIKAELLAIAGGLISPQEVIRRRGYQPDVVRKEWEEWFTSLKDDGLLDIMLALQNNRTALGGGDEQSGETAAKTSTAK